MFELATKKKSKLRLAIMGVSGSGKTYTALRIASGIAGGVAEKIALIDTEEGSASKYSDRFKFLEKTVNNASIDSLINIIDYVNQSDIEVLIIDSLSHAWQELLDEIDKLAKTKYQGNSFRAWGEGTPKQKRLIKAILQCKAHVIVTMRAKTEHVQEKDDRGKTIIRKVGTGVEQGKGIEYEFDMLIDLSQDHIAQITKDRTGKFQDALIEKPDEKFGKELKNWLDDGAEPTAQEKEEIKPAIPLTISDSEIAFLKNKAKNNNWNDSDIEELLTSNNISNLESIPKNQFSSISKLITKKEVKESPLPPLKAYKTEEEQAEIHANPTY